METSNNNVDATEIEAAILKAVDKTGEIADTGSFAQAHNWSHDDTFVGVIKRLEALSILLNFDDF